MSAQRRTVASGVATVTGACSAATCAGPLDAHAQSTRSSRTLVLCGSFTIQANQNSGQRGQSASHSSRL